MKHMYINWVVFFTFFHDRSDVRDLFLRSSFSHETGLFVTDFGMMLLKPRNNYFPNCACMHNEVDGTMERDEKPFSTSL